MANRTETITLQPGQNSLSQLTLFFTFNGKERVWEGADLSRGVSYNVKLLIDSEGNVREEYCIMPCDLK
jgi:hypothetical protein